ncbi:heterokaryon incompatibility (het-6OR allele) [Fusarium phyllophilum]|uniref:Heterokaryon incompatibility (Het-6OR allele) n=1 Tax=Fusarium phyllophilum TaxID=47803 RepID=A0A8H5NHE1_9HYPO|nr:heterokaryon incompatibility (het-6OR allele) [Fusarium phyllophilum]
MKRRTGGLKNQAEGLYLWLGTASNGGGVLGPTHIRLLHLLPATNIDDAIETRLEVVALEQNPVYEALSYCWGDNTHLQEIKCNDQKFQVTENLFSALQHLRNEDTERTLWIDAICINQKDLKERQAQVKLMKDIYAKSKRVVIWLGPDPASDGISHVFELMQTIPNLKRPGFCNEQRFYFNTSLPMRFSRPQGKCAKKKDFFIRDQAKKGAMAVYKRQWWSRVWTVQEMALAPSAIIMCGSLAAPALDIICTCNNVFMHGASSFDSGDSGDSGDLVDPKDVMRLDPDCMVCVAAMRCNRSVNTKMELGMLLHYHRWLRATDPRDKVYGSLGIASSTYGIEADYSISTVECYTRAAFKIISGNRSLDIFGALRRPFCIETTFSDLPSWVPDSSYDLSSIPASEKGLTLMNNHIMREYLRFAIFLESDDAFPEWKASNSSTKFNLRLLNDGKTLVVGGFIVDELKSRGRKLEYLTPGPKPPSNNRVAQSIRQLKQSMEVGVTIGRVMDIIQGWRDLAFKTKILKTMPNETRMDAFLTTMLINRIPLSADRRDSLNILEQLLKTAFEMTKSEIVMKHLHVSHLLPKLYHILLGHRKLKTIDMSDPLALGISLINLHWAIDQRMATTGSGYLCMVPGNTRAGDQIALLHGGRTPYVLRKAGEKWRIVGECYVHGIMSGEAWSDDKLFTMKVFAGEVFAALESTTLTITYALFNVCASDPSTKVWQALEEEALAVFPTNEIQTSLNDLHVADSVIKETLRLNTAIKALSVEVMPEDGLAVEYRMIDLPQGARVSISAWSFHHDEDIYPNAHTFDPFQFVPLHKNERIQDADSRITTSDNYIPFRIGKLSCPGRQFAAVVAKVFLPYLAMNYDLEEVHEKPRFLSLGHLPVPPMRAKLRIRKKANCVQS